MTIYDPNNQNSNFQEKSNTENLKTDISPEASGGQPENQLTQIKAKTARTWGCLLFLIFCILLFVQYILLTQGVLSTSDEGFAVRQSVGEFNTNYIYPGGWGVIDIRNESPLSVDEVYWYYDKTKMKIKNPDTGAVTDYKKSFNGRDFDYDDTRGASETITSGKVNSRFDQSETEYYVYGGGTIPKHIDYSKSMEERLGPGGMERITTAMVKFHVPEDYQADKIEAELDFTIKKMTNFIAPLGNRPGSYQIGTFPLKKTVTLTVLKDKAAYDKAKADTMRKGNSAGMNINRTINGIMLLLLVGSFGMMVYNLKKGYSIPIQDEKTE